MEMISGAFRLALSILGTCMSVWLTIYIVRNGGGVFKTIIRTITMAIKALCLKIQDMLIDAMKERTRRNEKPEHQDPNQVEARVV